jgi:hypothetical protein
MKFGTAVSLYNETVAVGTTSVSSVFIYQYVEQIWSQSSILVSSSLNSFSYFGSAISLYKGTLLVGAFFDTDSGAAYVYDRGSADGEWVERITLHASPSTSFSYFGSSVSIEEETAVVGSFATDNVFIFKKSSIVSWTQVQILVSASGLRGERFGFSVAIFGDSLIAGAHYNDDGGQNAGAAYVFSRSDGIWSQRAALYLLHSVQNSNFGYSVDIGIGIAVVTAPGNLTAVVFVQNPLGKWLHYDTLEPSIGYSFGRTASLCSSNIFIGDPSYDLFGFTSGVVSIFETPIFSSETGPSSMPSIYPSSSPSSSCPTLVPTHISSSLQPSSSPTRKPSAQFAARDSESQKSLQYPPLSSFFLKILFGSSFLYFFYVIVQQILGRDLDNIDSSTVDPHTIHNFQAFNNMDTLQAAELSTLVYEQNSVNSNEDIAADPSGDYNEDESQLVEMTLVA